ncbi:MAG: hypothetical protein ORN49_02845, partial [Rhodobacteraceae bacterium]|nr:hypothetical protein [Paracoccaceae bacterium]
MTATTGKVLHWVAINGASAGDERTSVYKILRNEHYLLLMAGYTAIMTVFDSDGISDSLTLGLKVLFWFGFTVLYCFYYEIMKSLIRWLSPTLGFERVYVPITSLFVMGLAMPSGYLIAMFLSPFPATSVRPLLFNFLQYYVVEQVFLTYVITFVAQPVVYTRPYGQSKTADVDEGNADVTPL